jgi:hypothetical protein
MTQQFDDIGLHEVRYQEHNDGIRPNKNAKVSPTAGSKNPDAVIIVAISCVVIPLS